MIVSSSSLTIDAGRRVYKKMATDGGGGVVGGLTATIATAKIGPGFESPKPG